VVVGTVPICTKGRVLCRPELRLWVFYNYSKLF
jgi:hypothetical protein